MKKLLTKIAIIMVGFTGVAVAQQDPQFTQWMHNKLIYNPGYAGTSGGICGVLQVRQQWASFTGAPVSISFAGDGKLTGIPLGVGLTFINDKIGPMSTNFVRIGGSYLIKAGAKGTLGLGLDLGLMQKSISATWIVPEPGKVDNYIPGAYEQLSNPTLNKASFDVGFGAFYNQPGRFYVGLSSTHLPAQSIGTGSVNFQVSRHFYFMTGYAFDINPRNQLIPNIKYKSDLAAGALDINLTYMYDKKFWGGATFRMNDAMAILLGYQHQLQGTTTIKGGLSYDFVLSKIKGYTSGTYELFLGACFTPKAKKITSYETDRYY